MLCKIRLNDLKTNIINITFNIYKTTKTLFIYFQKKTDCF